MCHPPRSRHQVPGHRLGGRLSECDILVDEGSGDDGECGHDTAKRGGQHDVPDRAGGDGVEQLRQSVGRRNRYIFGARLRRFRNVSQLDGLDRRSDQRIGHRLDAVPSFSLKAVRRNFLLWPIRNFSLWRDTARLRKMRQMLGPVKIADSTS